MRILIVEDDPLVGEVLAAALESSDHETVTAGTFEAATALLAEPNDLDAVVADYALGGVDTGLRIAEIAREAGIPCLLMTGHPDAAAEISGRNLNLLRKPFPLTELLAWLSQLRERPDYS